MLEEVLTITIPVSIHAPVQGATDCTEDDADNSGGFNPRPRAGGDPILYQASAVLFCFNPRPRAGGDLKR